ncbi:hypothetical protein [Clostridium novyi]
MKLKLSYTKLLSLYIGVMCVSLFWVNETIRKEILHLFSIDEKYNVINFLFLFVFICFMIKKCFYKLQNKIFILIMIMLIGMITLNILFFKEKLVQYILILNCYMIPMMFINIYFNYKDIKYVFEAFLKPFNVLVVVLFTIGILDYIYKGQIQLFIANKLSDVEFSKLIMGEHYSGIYRYYSFWGHPLDNAKLFLIFFIMNNIYNKYFNKNSVPKYIFIITIIGLILSGSKIALLLGGFLVLFFSDIKGNKYFYYILIIIIGIILFNTELFQKNLMERFIRGIQNHDFSSGRQELIKALISGDYIRPMFWIGGGEGFSRIISNSVGCGAMNFEYPIIMLAYDYGIFSTILIYVIIFIKPVIVFIKNKHYYILTNYLVLFIYINSNNGLASISDSMAQFCFIVLFLISTSMYLKKLNLEGQ